MGERDYEVRRILDPRQGGAPAMGRSAWEALAEARRRFIADGVLLAPCPALRPEIAESWDRCRSAGVDPDATVLAVPLSDEDRRQVMAVYGGLVEAARPLMGIIDDLHLADDYIFELVARNGVTVLQLGNLVLHDVVADGSIMNEPSMGTNAHTLCMRQKTPLSVVGPEHYCAALHGLAALAAPVFDKHGIVIASLLLTQPLPAEPWSEDYQKLLSHALGFIASIASALEHQLVFQDSLAMLAATGEKLEAATEYGQRARHVLDIAMGFTNEPILVLDAAGVVQHASPEAIHLLHLTLPDVVGHPAEDVLGLPWAGVLQALGDGQGGEVIASVGGREFGLRGNAVRSVAGGALDGLVLVLSEVKNARGRASGAGEEASITFDDILGNSMAMNEARDLARRYAMTGENVLIIGESGTGKEYFAQAIHNASRAKGPFMSVNCAAIPPRLIESELFGYESGAFTGAERGGKPGKIELADGGTLFLDEIGDMPLELQATLLRVLENKRVMRLGGKAYRQVDFRVVAATNRDLGAMVREGTFREDLLYRLSILTVPLPPLRARNGDVVFFAHYFLNECRRKAHEGPTGFTAEAERLIATFPWPGNVRQIKNAVYSAFYAAPGEDIAVNDLPQYVREGREGLFAPLEAPTAAAAEGEAAKPGDAPTATPPVTAPAGMPLPPRGEEPGAADGETVSVPDELLSLQAVEESAIKLAMVYAGGNVARAAELLEISKATLYRKIKEYGLRQ
ncbi:sigma-54 interaction domain-containing protein [Adlercreutzia faecimuris]|uniref:Sigma 54-interacting transcriptional regulator n=1 Tax=Adlercreutzia faecimuris TaxID=2897341 RepID=A0ABS9WE31_9ACTN|nr:sigma 54-interacting transcriptional regulator [Adlercreutzia sp. JBNU-10]MCI2241123.1 sigma 54-interacting transcriptional regulator [Adlercreutzia sp. JBNU-10]